MRNSPEPGRCAAAVDRASPLFPARLCPPTRAIAANSFISPNKLYQTKRAPRPASARPAVPAAAGLPAPLTRARIWLRRARQTDGGVIASGPYESLYTPFAVDLPSSSERSEMTTKRRRENQNETEIGMKRQRSRKRSSSEPGLLHDPINAKKRQVLKRLFGRNTNVGFVADTASSTASYTFTRNNFRGPDIRSEPETYNDHEYGTFAEFDIFEHDEPDEDDLNADERRESGDEGQYIYYSRESENADPLLDSVPVDLDPERLGFLVCAQETLRFLNRRGFAFEHPVFSRLRSRLLRGMDEMAVA